MPKGNIQIHSWFHSLCANWLQNGFARPAEGLIPRAQGSHGEPPQDVSHLGGVPQKDTRQQVLFVATKICMRCREPFFHSAHTITSSTVEQVTQRESTTSILRNFQNPAEQGPSLPLKLSLFWAWRWLLSMKDKVTFKCPFQS